MLEFRIFFDGVLLAVVKIESAEGAAYGNYIRSL